MTKTCYLMRHGRTRFNEQGRIQGACDSPLTEEGMAQAKAAKVYFDQEGIQFDRVYSSTQERACDTAELATWRTDYIRLKGIKEWDFGSFEAHQEYLNPHLYREDGSGYRDYFVAYGGESNVQVYSRMRDTIRDILEETAADATLLFVSHGGAIGQFFRNVTKNPPQLSRRISNCAIFKIRYDEGEFEVASIYDPLDQTFIYERGKE